MVVKSLSREELDAKKCSDAYVEAFQKIAESFDSDIAMSHPDPSDGSIDPNHPTDIRRGRDAKTLSIAFGKLRSAYTTIYKNRMSSGNNGSEDKDGKCNVTDHMEVDHEEDHEEDTVAVINPYLELEKMKPFSDFSMRAKKNGIGPEIIDFVHKFCSRFPSMLPFLVRTLPTGFGASEGGVKRKKKGNARPNKSNKLVENMKDILTGISKPTESESRLSSTNELMKLYELVDLYTKLNQEDKIVMVQKRIKVIEKALGFSQCL